ncbi:MAG: hypothetical protein H7Y42_08050, partial [Chitinophagaceae bacterium]|nr:hypothetical protein [Chitinophagaceae bacterium]
FFYDGMFIYLDSVRFTFENDLLVEYNLDFFKLPQLKFPILIKDLEEREISNNTPMNRMIMLLNVLKIKYKNIHVSSADYLILQTENRVNIYFDLDDGKLYRIGKLDSSI